MNGMKSSARAISFLMRTRILASHASFAPFVLSERIIFSLSGHLYKISQQSHESFVGNQPAVPGPRGICPVNIRLPLQDAARKAPVFQPGDELASL